MNSIPLGGSNEVDGAMILGIGTSSNNMPTGVSAYALDARGNFTTQFQGETFPDSFIDSGSNGIYFPNAANLPICSDESHAPGFFCPDSTQVFSATNLSASSSSSVSIEFAIGNANDLAQSPGTAFLELGGPATSSFDWGLPFFFGRAVFVGIEGKTSSLGNGIYIAY
jgi:hypothetical protein